MTYSDIKTSKTPYAIYEQPYGSPHTRNYMQNKIYQTYKHSVNMESL